MEPMNFIDADIVKQKNENTGKAIQMLFEWEKKD